MQIPDVGTASLLYKLFNHLFDYGVVVVATSNRRPEDLYQGHFREELFDPFVKALGEKVEVVELDSCRDYRMGMLGDSETSISGTDNFFVGADADEHATEAWKILTAGEEILTEHVSVFGRDVLIPECTEKGVARFPFHYLCGQPLGPGRYGAPSED